jgi:hypothetical protein
MANAALASDLFLSGKFGIRMECADYHLGAASNGSKVPACHLCLPLLLKSMKAASAPSAAVVVQAIIVTTTACSQVILSAPSDELRNLWIMAMSIAGVTQSFRFWAKKQVCPLVFWVVFVFSLNFSSNRTALQGHAMKNWKRRFFLIHAGMCYYFEGESDPVAKGVVPLTGASVAAHQTEDPLFMGVKVTVHVPFAIKFKESHKSKDDKIKTWPELILQVMASCSRRRGC